MVNESPFPWYHGSYALLCAIYNEIERCGGRLAAVRVIEKEADEAVTRLAKAGVIASCPKLPVKPKRRRGFTKEEDRYLRHNWTRLTESAMAHTLNRNRETLIKRAAALGFVGRKKYGKRKHVKLKKVAI